MGLLERLWEDLQLAEHRGRLEHGVRAAVGVRAAEPDEGSPSGWRVNAWVKQGILLGFRASDVVDMSPDDRRLLFFDKDLLPLRPMEAGEGVRIVPGGSSIRHG